MSMCDCAFMVREPLALGSTSPEALFDKFVHGLPDAAVLGRCTHVQNDRSDWW